ncbi:hypothetical protein LCGC14_0855420 [marine sediment metagenome]|uniref:Uncharacterized protein n=1 Tax=marine sediment metagenome TaxID=412755 RepID=A0A0F9RTL5_9ZZZZ
MVLKAGQKVWYINNTWNELKEGVLVSRRAQPLSDEHPTLYVKDEYSRYRILTNWVFTTKEKGRAGLKGQIQRDIQRKKKEVKRLEKKL